MVDLVYWFFFGEIGKIDHFAKIGRFWTKFVVLIKLVKIGKMGDFDFNDDFSTIGEIGGFDQIGKICDFDSNDDFRTIGEMSNFW